MINWLLLLFVTILLGAGLMSGMFFAFSTFIMKALSRIPSVEGIRAMQSINVVVINPIVMTVLIGTAILSAWMMFLVLRDSLSHWFFVGGAHYVFGTFFVTVFANVPLNNRLENVLPEKGEEVWRSYLDKWTFWNHVRTIAALIAVFCLTMGLLQA